MVKISALTSDSAPTSTDYLIVNDTETTTTKKVLISNLYGAWTTWAPTWTNLTVSSSTVVAKYTQVGKTVFMRITVILGGGNAPSGDLKFTLPVTAISDMLSSDNYAPIGNAEFHDTAVQSYNGRIRLTSTTQAQVVTFAVSGSNILYSGINGTTPFTWGNGDGISIIGTYEAA